MSAPIFNSAGEPTNLEAAALDALDWLEFTDNTLRLGPDNAKRLKASIKALKKFLPKEKPVFMEDAA